MIKWQRIVALCLQIDVSYIIVVNSLFVMVQKDRSFLTD